MTAKILILDDFEHGDSHKYELNHDFVTSYNVSINRNISKQGTTSLKVDYHFGGWKSGNGAMYIIFKENLSTAEPPLKFGLWVYGDGKSPWLRATFVDGLGDKKIVNLTEKNMDWTGWKYVDAEIDPSWAMPLKLDNIYAVEVNKKYKGNRDYGGAFYLNDLRFVYVDDIDLKGPIFSDVYPGEEKIYQDSFTFSAIVSDEMSGVDAETIKVQFNDEQVNHRYSEHDGKINYNFKNLEEGTNYISATAKDFAGNISMPGIEKKITVDLSPDVDKPALSNLAPTQNVTVYTDTPRITFHLIDVKSGIDKKDIQVLLNGIELVVTYDVRTGWGYALPTDKLETGEHAFTITAKDKAGNSLGPVKNQFNVHTLPQHAIGEPFSLTVIPDTHSGEYAELALRHASAETSDIVIHMGDMVDEATETEFYRFQQHIEILESKILLSLPGNHEAFLGNLDFYICKFGAPTYHYEYGDLLMIALNSAYEQSISASDSTQFDYLQRVLEANRKNNVLITSHVPTKDPFGTAHEMKQDDARQLEQILGDYKKKNNGVNIMVLFGHLHVLRQWKKDGIDYIITGNGAQKGYVDQVHGNILGYGVLRVHENGMAYNYKPYVDRIYMAHENICVSHMEIREGDTAQLNVFGEIDKLQTTYEVALTPFALIEKKWSSYDGHVAQIDDSGLLQAIGKGVTIIEVEVNDKQASLKVRVV